MFRVLGGLGFEFEGLYGLGFRLLGCLGFKGQDYFQRGSWKLACSSRSLLQLSRGLVLKSAHFCF